MPNNETVDGVTLFIIALIIIAFLMTSGSKLSNVSSNAVENKTFYYETHTTTIDICGVCINSDH